jgi:hypothetical protein
MNQHDVLSWFMDEAEGEEKGDRALLDRLLTLNFAAIHTSSLVGPYNTQQCSIYPDNSSGYIPCLVRPVIPPRISTTTTRRGGGSNSARRLD